MDIRTYACLVGKRLANPLSSTIAIGGAGCDYGLNRYERKFQGSRESRSQARAVGSRVRMSTK